MLPLGWGHGRERVDGGKAQIDRLLQALPDSVTEDRRRQAIGTYAAMIGALILARAVDDPALSDKILDGARI